MDRVTIFCFAASYGVALALEVVQLLTRWRLRLLTLGFGLGGIIAHTIYLAAQSLPLVSSLGSLMFLAWILAVFYLYGSIHHKHIVWGLFVLPLVLGLILVGVLFSPAAGTNRSMDGFLSDLRGKHFWNLVHGFLLLFAAVGVCVGFVASIMYLVQVHRLRAKVAQTQGMKMLSLERIEAMNRRAILCAFPLLTVGLLVGVALMLKEESQQWNNLKILSVGGLWLVFVILLYLRYSVHVRGRQVAWLTVFSFLLLILAMVSAHPLVQGGPP